MDFRLSDKLFSFDVFVVMQTYNPTKCPLMMIVINSELLWYVTEYVGDSTTIALSSRVLARSICQKIRKLGNIASRMDANGRIKRQSQRIASSLDLPLLSDKSILYYLSSRSLREYAWAKLNLSAFIQKQNDLDDSLIVSELVYNGSVDALEFLIRHGLKVSRTIFCFASSLGVLIPLSCGICRFSPCIYSILDF